MASYRANGALHPASAKQSETAIPLLCIICPKSPKFSDVSHLLTHISSKSHLSTKFKLQLRAQKELTVREQLEAFERWYVSNGIENLLAERMLAKDQKAVRTGKRGRPSVNVGTDSHSVRHRPTDSSIFGQSTVLVAPQNQPLPALGPATSQPGNSSMLLPRLHHWTTAPAVSSSPFGPPPHPFYLNPLHEASFSQEQNPINFPYTGPLDYGQIRDETSSATSFNLSEHDIDAYKGDNSDTARSAASKLKGVIWPGMDWFDAATDEMKRKRNQKKDFAVLEQMQRTSSVVEPTEFIWNSEGELQRTRDVYASPSIDGSPVCYLHAVYLLLYLDANAANRSRRARVCKSGNVAGALHSLTSLMFLTTGSCRSDPADERRPKLRNSRVPRNLPPRQSPWTRMGSTRTMMCFVMTRSRPQVTAT